MATLGYEILWHHSDDGDPSLKVHRYAGADAGDATTSITLPTYNEWHHLVVVSNGERQIVYLDGTEKDYTEFTPTADVTDGGPLQLGSSSDPDNGGWSGNVSYAEHSVTPYALTGEEIGDLYAAGQGIYPAGNSYPGLVRKVITAEAYYRLTERDSDITQDDMASLDAAYAGDHALSTTVGALRGGFQPGATFYSSPDGIPGHVAIADSAKQDFFDSNGDFSVVLFYRRDREYRFGPMDMASETIGTSGTTLTIDIPDGNHETSKAQPGDMWLYVGSHTDTAEDVGASLVTNGFTSLWNATQTDYRTFAVYRYLTQADIDAHETEVTTGGSVNLYGTTWLIRSARDIEAVHNNAGSDPTSINPSWAETEYLFRTYGGWAWSGSAPVVDYYATGNDVRTTSETYDPSDIDMGANTEESSWTIAIRGFSDGSGDLGPSTNIFQRHDGTDGHIIAYDPDNDEIVFSRDLGATVHTVTIQEPSLDEWHMVVATYDGTADEMTVYIDGSLATAKTGNNPQTSALNVGTLATTTYLMNTATPDGLKFLASDLSMHDFALTAEQVAQMWEAARGGISARGSLMMRWTSGSRNGFTFPFDLGVMDFGYILPFDIVGTDNAFGWQMPFILDGPGAAGPNGYRDLATAMLPASYWTFDEDTGTYLDSVGSVAGTHTGTFDRGVTPPLVPVPNSKMIDFTNSTASYVDFGDNHDFNATAAFSFSGVMRDDGQDDSVNIITKYDSGGYYVSIDGSDILTFGRDDDSTITEVNSTTALSGVHHLAFTFDGTDLRLYVDGVLEGGPTASAEVLPNTTASLIFGGDAFAGLNAAMDEWGVWDRALTDDEVWTLSQSVTNIHKEDSGFVLPFDLDGPVESEFVLPFSILDATTGTEGGAILAPLVGWYDPIVPKVLSYIELARSVSGSCGLWPYDEASGAEAFDHLGGIDWDYIGSPTLGVQGPFKDGNGTAVLLDGASQSIRYPDETAGDYLHLGDTLSMVIWFKRDGIGAEELYCAGTGGLEVGFDGSDQPYAAKEGTGNFFTTTTTVTDTAWHMLVVTKVGSSRAMYLDGAALTNSAGDQTLTDTSGDIHVGRHQPSATAYFDGTVAALGLYDVGLDAATILDLYTRARG